VSVLWYHPNVTSKGLRKTLFYFCQENRLLVEIQNWHLPNMKCDCKRLNHDVVVPRNGISDEVEWSIFGPAANEVLTRHNCHDGPYFALLTCLKPNWNTLLSRCRLYHDTCCFEVKKKAVNGSVVLSNIYLLSKWSSVLRCWLLLGLKRVWRELTHLKVAAWLSRRVEGFWKVFYVGYNMNWESEPSSVSL
jgi:hypothetical protein